MINPDTEKLARAMFSAATRFHRSAYYLSKQSMADGLVTLPIFVNLAFALEMYLKCLIVLDTGLDASWKHDYVVLFSKLSPETQVKIRTAFDKHPQTIINKKLSDVMVTHGEPLAAEQFSFDTMLARSKDAFTKFRYIYQYLTDTNWDAGPILDCAITVIRELRPNWMLDVGPTPTPVGGGI